MKYLILAEKPSAARHFAEALGGFSGFFNMIPNNTGTDSYDIVAAHGHLLELKEPHEMVAPEKVAKYKDWTNLGNFPWNPNDFTWEKRPKKGAQETLTQIKNASHGHDAIIIATDDDPSGEGDVLGQEIVDYIGWHKPVLRARFTDESPNSLKKALTTLTDVTDKATYGKYQKGIARERFDFLSMQLSRIALISERTADFAVKTQKLGRDKSVIIGLIYYQLEARKNYVKKPFFEIRFKDKDNHIFKEQNAKNYDQLNLAEFDTRKMNSSTITVTNETLKKQEPPKMLDFSHLSAIIGKHGFNSRQVIDTYQTMYQHGIVSYPRTADRKITQEDFNILLPLAPKIAKAINLDAHLLTQTTCRPKFLIKKADHGANRPGTNVPPNLATIEEEYGFCGKLIYETLARSFLAILGSDYTYKQIDACLTSYPTFKSSIKIPKNQGFKDIFNSDSLKEKDEALTITNFDQNANPFTFEGQNPKPKEPTHLFVVNYLSKHNIGTGATQETILAEISTGKNKLIENKKEKYSLTNLGLIQAIISRHTLIASPKVTLELQEAMDQVEKLAVPTMAVPNTMANIVIHDKQTMINNQQNLTSVPELQKAKVEWNKRQEKINVPKITGNWQGREVSVKSKWGDHSFTKSELTQLFADKTITFDTEQGKVSGKLAEQTYKRYKFVGFCPNLPDKSDDFVTGTFVPTNKQVSFKKQFGTYIFSPQDIKKLLLGEEITIQAIGKSGKPYSVTGQLKNYIYNGKKCFGFKANFPKEARSHKK
ncbi:DNA topoisomerase [Lactobacillus bombicola]|uniref:Type IA DNA topoisomerase n=1 Tax=Lactobacillus bombicola TaxID=1505723 RepID=A0A396STW0_9LACO|nr:DNA topoisomerase [Lactobacillus bombicola]RHW55066.1 type IA DNA topoisomerase [Lactobacillus bombicola]